MPGAEVRLQFYLAGYGLLESLTEISNEAHQTLRFNLVADARTSKRTDKRKHTRKTPPKDDAEIRDSVNRRH